MPYCFSDLHRAVYSRNTTHTLEISHTHTSDYAEREKEMDFSVDATLGWILCTRTRSRSLTSSNKRAEGRTYCSESSTYDTRPALNICCT
eukprot:g80960.t1